MKVEEVVVGGVQATVRVTVEIDRKDKPACAIDTISRYYLAWRQPACGASERRAPDS